jgi:hypothetical protein
MTEAEAGTKEGRKRVLAAAGRPLGDAAAEAALASIVERWADQLVGTRGEAGSSVAGE